MRLFWTVPVCLIAALSTAETRAQYGWHFQRQDSLGPDLLSVQFSDHRNGWVVGDGNSILHTDDGGETWYHQTGPTTGNFFQSVCFVDSLNGWAAGNNHTIIHTTDGGRTWELQLHEDTPTGFESICFADAARGWAVGWVSWVQNHFILHTTDSGKTWIEQRAGGGVMRAVCFLDSLQGWVVGDAGEVLRTTDGGGTWEVNGTGVFLLSVCFVNARTGWVCGGGYYGPGVILNSTDAGVTWKEQLRDSTGWFSSLFFIDEGKGWAVNRGETTGSIHFTSDGGTTWQKQRLGIPRPYSVWFTDSLTGWVVGAQGTIMHTRNGGMTFIPRDRTSNIPAAFSVCQNYPNPFNPSTTINYELPRASHVTLTVYDLLGREVATLLNEVQQPGYKSVQFNAANLASGLYFYRLTAGDYVSTKKMLVLR